MLDEKPRRRCGEVKWRAMVEFEVGWRTMVEVMDEGFRLIDGRFLLVDRSIWIWWLLNDLLRF